MADRSSEFPHVVAVSNFDKRRIMTRRIGQMTAAALWLADRGALVNEAWIEDATFTDTGLQILFVMFKDPDLAFEFKMRWA